jgi:hypothetical protein
MNNARTCTSWGLAVLAILLSPVIVIFSIPLAIGVGVDILDAVGEAPIALALCVPVAFVLLRLVSPRAVLRQLAAALSRPRHRLDRPSGLNYAPKSIS